MKKNLAIRMIKNASGSMADNLISLINFRYAVPDSIEALRISKTNLIEFSQVIPGLRPEQIILDNWQEEIDFLKTIPATLYPMIIVYSITMFEVFLTEVTKVLMSHFWQSLKSRDKSMSYEDLLSFNSIDELRDHIIESDLMKFSFGSIKERIRFLEKKYSLKFSYVKTKGIRANWNCIEFDELVELHAARNLIVHNAGFVNKIYLNEIQRAQYKPGDKLDINEQYVLDSLTLLFRVMGSIRDVCVNKIRG